ncbi:MAG: hypothetical protein J5486_04170 [Bacteroidaceae bacterium]|nr:hypothetical protein [Bacteroidaceae bacterium]
MKINFDSVKVYTNVSHTEFTVEDIRAAFADMIYRMGQGVAAHALALKIYNSKPDTDYSQDEVQLMKQFAGTYGTPAFIDAINSLSGS